MRALQGAPGVLLWGVGRDGPIGLVQCRALVGQEESQVEAKRYWQRPRMGD